MASTKQLDPRVLEFLKRANNGKVQAESDFAGLPAAPVAHREDWNHPPPEGSIKPDPYGNAILDAVSGGIAGALRPGVTAAAEAAAEAAHVPTVSASVSREELQRLSPAEILRKLGNSRAETRAITEAAPTYKVTSRVYEATRKLDPGHAGSTPAWEEAVSPAREKSREAVTGNFTPPKRITGEVPVTAETPAPAVPGEAEYAGKTPAQRQVEQATVLRKHREVNGYATGGVVGGPVQSPEPHHVYHAAAGCVAKYAGGGPVEPTDVNDAHTPELIPQAKIVPEPDTVPQAELAPAGVPQVASAPPVSDPKVAAGNAELQKADDPATRRLELLERLRDRTLAGSEPTAGQRVARGIGSALTAFGGGKPTDFAAEDRANRGEINANFDRQRKDFLTTPGEVAARGESVAGSPQSVQYRALVAKTLGVPVDGLSADQVKAALPILSLFQQAKVAGNTLEMQRLVEEGRKAVEAHKESVDEQKLDIDRQNAESNRIRATKTGAEPQQKSDRALLAAVDTANGAPDVQVAVKSLQSLDVLEPLLNSKTPLSAKQVLFLASNLAKIEGGGVASQHVIEALTSPTLQGKINASIEYLTGHPGDAGQSETVQKIFKPYAKELRKILQGTVSERTHRIIDNFSKTASPGLVDHLRQQEDTRFPPIKAEDPFDNFKDLGATPSE